MTPFAILPALALGVLLAPPPLAAHNPVDVLAADPTRAEPWRIPDPDISRAFYGRLDGAPEYYLLNVEKTVEFYFNILVPNTSTDRERRPTAGLENEAGTRLAEIGGPGPGWEAYFERFGGDNYIRGPERRIRLEPGRYILAVTSAGQRGRYALATGEREWWGPLEIVATLFLLPKLKREFFDKQ